MQQDSNKTCREMKYVEKQTFFNIRLTHKWFRTFRADHFF